MSGAAGGAAAAAAIAQAIKASGAIVRVTPDTFQQLLYRQEAPLVVQAEGGLFRRSYHYLTGYKGLVFFTKAKTPLQLPGTSEVIVAGRIWIPG